MTNLLFFAYFDYVSVDRTFNILHLSDKYNIREGAEEGHKVDDE